MDTVNKLMKSDIIGEKNVHGSAKIILFLLLIGPLIFTFCLCLYLFKRYNEKKFKKKTHIYDDLEYQRSDTSEFSEPIFEANLKKFRVYNNKRSDLKSDQKRKLLDKLRKKLDAEAEEADIESKERQRIRLYKGESRKWKRKYDRLKQRLESIQESDQSFKKESSKEEEDKDRSESEEVELDKKEAKDRASNHQNVTTSDESKAVASESLTVSEVSESDQKDQKKSLLRDETQL